MRKTIAAAALLVIALSAAAQDRLSLSPSPRFWGATLNVRYALVDPSVQFTETTLLARATAAYAGGSYLRFPDGRLFTSAADGFTAEATAYDRFDSGWGFGVEQGIVPAPDRSDDALVVFALYRGRYELPLSHDGSLFAQSGLPEAEGALQGALLGGVGFDSVAIDPVTAASSGASAEASFEWGPGFLHNQLAGAANYGRVNLTATAFAPVFSLVDHGERVLSLYQASFASVDYGFGPELPFVIRSTFGGRAPRSGLGGAVRGYETSRYDADFKAVFNTELRANGPSLVLPRIVPGLLLHYDAGYFLDTRALSPDVEDRDGFVQSIGAGIFLQLTDIAEFVFYTHGLLSEPSIEDTRWIPFSLGFGFHY